jgi:hypothetical protein
VDFNLDIVGGVVGSLVEVARNCTSFDGEQHAINMYFEHENDCIAVRPTKDQTHVGVTLRRPGDLRLRKPPWATEVSAQNVPAESVSTDDEWITVSNPPVKKELEFRLTLRDKQLELVHRTRTIPTVLRGSHVCAMAAFGADLTFFPELPLRADEEHDPREPRQGTRAGKRR